MPFWFEDFHTEKLCSLVICAEPRPERNLANISLPRTEYYLNVIAESTGETDPCLGIIGVWQDFTRFDDMSERRRKAIVNALYLDPDWKMPALIGEFPSPDA